MMMLEQCAHNNLRIRWLRSDWFVIARYQYILTMLFPDSSGTLKKPQKVFQESQPRSFMLQVCTSCKLKFNIHQGD